MSFFDLKYSEQTSYLQSKVTVLRGRNWN